MKPSHLDYYFWLNSDWASLGADRLEYARAAPERGHPLQAGRPARRLRAHRRRAAGPALAGTTDYRVAELRRWCRKLGIPVNPHPAHMCPNADQASRLVIAADLQAAGGGAVQGHPSCRVVRTAISRPNPRCARSRLRRGWTPTPWRAAAAPDVERRYRQYTDEAVAAGAFGSPSYVYAGELFWGQDRLEMLEEAIAAV